MDRHELAKEIYKEFVKAITDLEEKHSCGVELPKFIDIDGERFYKHELTIFSTRKIK